MIANGSESGGVCPRSANGYSGWVKHVPFGESDARRMNLFDLASYHALIDYAHNPHSYSAGGLSAIGRERIVWWGRAIAASEDFFTRQNFLLNF